MTDNDTHAIEPIEHPLPRSCWDELLDYLFSRRKQLQDWDSSPPYSLALGIFILVCVELGLSIALTTHSGLGKPLMKLIIGIASALFLMEVVFASAAKETASLFNNTGKSSTAWTLMSIGLMPLLLYLPIVVLTRLSSTIQNAHVLILILLVLQVISNWRESVEVAFELSRLHSAIMMYILSVLVVLLMGLIVYISVLQKFSDFFDSF